MFLAWTARPTPRPPADRGPTHLARQNGTSAIGREVECDFVRGAMENPGIGGTARQHVAIAAQQPRVSSPEDAGDQLPKRQCEEKFASGFGDGVQAAGCRIQGERCSRAAGRCRHRGREVGVKLRDARVRRRETNVCQEVVARGVMRRPRDSGKIALRFGTRSSPGETDTRRCRKDTTSAGTAVASCGMVATSLLLGRRPLRRPWKTALRGRASVRIDAAGS